MAASRRRTTKKNLGQTINDVDRRLKSVEFRGNTRTAAPTTVNGSAIENDSITIEKLNPEFRRILKKLMHDAETINTIVLPSMSNLQDYGVSISSFAQETADGKNTIIYQNEKPDPEGRQVDDLWFDTDDGYKPWKFNGTEWVEATFGDGAISDLNVGKLTTGTFSVGMTMSVGAQRINNVNGTGVDKEFWTRLTAMNQPDEVGEGVFQQNTDAFEMRMVDNINADNGNGYFSRIAMSMVYDPGDSTNSMNPVLRIQRKNLLPKLVDVSKRNESRLTGLTDQEIAIWAMTPFDMKYSPYLRGLPSISFDDPSGVPVGHLGSYDFRRFGLEAASGKAWMTIVDEGVSNRKVQLHASGNTTNSRSATLIIQGDAGEINVDNGLFSPLPLMCRLHTTGIAQLDSEKWAAINHSTFRFPATPETNFFYGYYVFQNGKRLSGTSNGVSVTNRIPVITVPKLGYYRISGQVAFGASPASGSRKVQIRAIAGDVTSGITNSVGTNVVYAQSSALAGHEVSVNYDGVVALNKDVNICVWAYSSNDVNVLYGISNTFICVEYIGLSKNYDIAT